MRVIKKRFLDWTRFCIRLLPRSKLLNFIANTYTDKFYNAMNSNPMTNGEKIWLQRALVGIESPVIFDVGANIGEWSELALSIYPKALIHAFEPVRDSYEHLKKRCIDCAQINQIGLADIVGRLDMYIYKNASAHNTLHPRHDELYSSVETVKIDTIDNYCSSHNIQNIDYLKIDTEGHDLYVLRGAKKLLQEGRVRFIQFEYGNNYIDARVFLKDIFDLVASLDYKVYRIMPKHLQYIPNYHHAYERFVYTNYALIHRRSESKTKIE